MTVEWSLAEGDKWLAQSVATYEGGGGMQTTAAEAAIASAYFNRSVAQALAEVAEEDRINAQLTQEVQDSMARHPAGSKLVRGHRFVPGAGIPSRCAHRVGVNPCGQLGDAPVHRASARGVIVEQRGDDLPAMSTPPNPRIPRGPIPGDIPSEVEGRRGYWPPGDLGDMPDGDEG